MEFCERIHPLATVLRPVHAVFNHKGVRSFLLKCRYPFIFVFLALLIPRIRPALLLPGFLVSLAGEFVQLWSFASLEKNRSLTVRGPYRMTRNPMYIGRFFLILGAVVLTGSLWAVLAFSALYYFYAVNRVKREEARLRRLFGPEYEAYCRRVNRFVPRIGHPAPGFEWSFNLRLLVENNGHWNLIAMLSAYSLFYFSRVLVLRFPS